MRKPVDAFTPPTTDDPFQVGERVLLVRCTECYRVMGVLLVMREYGEPMPTEADVDAVLAAAYWADSGFPAECSHTDRLPPIATLRSYVVKALRRGLGGTSAPVPVRI